MHKIINNQKGGTALLLVVFILVTIISATLVISSIVKTSIVMSRNQLYSTIAFYAADAGVERLLYSSRNDSAFNLATCINPNDYVNFNISTNGCAAPQASFTFTAYPINASSTVIFKSYVLSSDLYTFHSYGSYRDIQRRIELEY
jgi:hypothetical protein